MADASYLDDVAWTREVGSSTEDSERRACSGRTHLPAAVNFFLSRRDFERPQESAYLLVSLDVQELTLGPQQAASQLPRSHVSLARISHTWVGLSG